MILEGALSPGFKLLGERLVEATDGTGTRSNAHQGLDHFPDLVGTHPSDKHLGKSFGNVRFIAAVAFKGLRMKLALPIARNFDLLEPTGRCHEVAGVGTVAIAFTFRVRFSPSGSNKRIQFLAHNYFYYRPNGTLSQGTQMLMKFLLL